MQVNIEKRVTTGKATAFFCIRFGLYHKFFIFTALLLEVIIHLFALGFKPKSGILE